MVTARKYTKEISFHTKMETDKIAEILKEIDMREFHIVKTILKDNEYDSVTIYFNTNDTDIIQNLLKHLAQNDNKGYKLNTALANKLKGE